MQTLGKEHEIGGFTAKPQPACTATEGGLSYGAIEVWPSRHLVSKVLDQSLTFRPRRAGRRMRRVVPPASPG